MKFKHNTLSLFYIIISIVGIIISQPIYNPNYSIKIASIEQKLSDWHPPYRVYGGYHIVSGNLTMNNTITVNAGEVLEIKNSVLDFGNLPNVEALIYNYGTLVIENSTIISNLVVEQSSVIYGNGNTTILHSKFVNRRLTVDFEASQITYIYAVRQDAGALTIISSQFRNYTKAIDSTSAYVETIYNNSFVDCPFGIVIDNVNNTVVKGNKFRNSFITGIEAYGDNITIQNNYIFNERNMLQGSSAASERHEEVKIIVEVTIGIHFEGSYSSLVNNTVINTFKAFYVYASNHIYIEDNFISTNSGEREGELQLQSVDFCVIRNNTLIKQWDPIEIYNSRHIIVEKNYIEKASSGIVLEKVDYLRDVSPENITVRDNVLVDAPSSGADHAKNVQFINNIFKHSNLVISGQSKNILVMGNTIYMGYLAIWDAHSIIVRNNKIDSNILGVIVWNSENVTLQNNTIYCFLIPLPVPEVLLQNLIIALVIFIGIPIIAIILLIRKIRKRKHRGVNK